MQKILIQFNFCKAMKKVKFLSFLLMMSMIGFSFVSCGDDDDNDDSGEIVNGGNNNGGNNNGGSSNNEADNTLRPLSVGDFSFAYDENGKVTSFSCYDSNRERPVTVNVSYNPFTLSYQVFDGEGENNYDKISVTNVKFNNAGYITKANFKSEYITNEASYGYYFNETTSGSVSFKYSDNFIKEIALDGNGKMTEEEDGEKYSVSFNAYGKAEYTYSNGNLQQISCTRTTEGGGSTYDSKYVQTFEYDTLSNDNSIFNETYANMGDLMFIERVFGGLFFMNMLGEASVNFPTKTNVKITQVSMYENWKMTADVTEIYSNYRFDAVGALSSYDITGTYAYVDEEDGYSYENSYDYNYTVNYSFCSQTDTPSDSVARIDTRSIVEKKVNKVKGFFGRRK